MMKTKRFIISVLTVLCLVALTACLVGCDNGGEQQKPGEHNVTPGEPKYEYVYSSQFDGPSDPDIYIDGKLDEAVWQNKKWYTSRFYTDFYDTMPKLTVTAFNTEYGAYMGVKVRDDNIIYNGMLYLDRNSLIEFYFYAEKTDTVVGDRDYSLRRAFMMDYAGELYSTGERMKRAITVDGEINSGNTVGATFEIFVPWSEMGIDVSDGVYPQKFYLLPTYRPILKGNSAHTPLFNVPFNPMNHIKDFYVFDEDGYTDEDAEGAIVGDSYYGTAKSAAWDLEDADKGVVGVSTGVEFNSIFFKDAFSENFTAETSIYPTGGSNEKGYEGWYGGFFLMSTNGNYYTMMLDLRNSKLTAAADGGKAFKEYSLVTLTEAHTYWEQVNKINKTNPAAQNAVPENSGATFKIIKDKDKIYYFVDGEYLYSETLDFVQGKVYAGLFNMNAFATYENFSFRALTDEEVAYELDSSDIFLVDVSATGGGYAEADSRYVVKGNAAEIKFVSDSGYKLSSVTFNGVDVTAAVFENAVGGTYTIDSVTDNIDVDVAFEKIQNPVTYKGYLKDGFANAEENIYIIDKNNGASRYDVYATEAGGFEVSLAAGEYEVFVDNNFGSTSVTLTGNLTQNVNLSDYVALDKSDIHYLNVDFIKQRANSVKGNVTEWFLLKDSSTKAYLSANFYNYDLDGFTVETDGGDNVQFYLAYQGLYVLKNHDWYTVSGVKYTKYSLFDSSTRANVLNAASMDRTGGAKVEIAIDSGVLYMVVDGYGKINLPLSEFNANFTATAKYRIGLCTYNANNTLYPASGAVYENITAAFGNKAAAKVNEIKAACTYEEFTLGEELYTNTFMSKVGSLINYSAKEAGAQIMQGVEIEQDTPFMIYADIKKSETNGFGFVVGTLGDTNANHVLFNYRQGTKDIYISRESNGSNWGWMGIEDRTYPVSYPMMNEMQFALVYEHGLYMFYINGELVANVSENDKFAWSTKSFKDVIGATGAKKIGLSVLYGSVGITNYGYTTDVDEIESFMHFVPLYGNSKIVDTEDGLNITSTSAGAFVLYGVEVEQGKNYMLSVKVDPKTAENVGFVVGTLNGNGKNHMLFEWRYRADKHDIIIWRHAASGWSWMGIDDTCTEEAYPDLTCEVERGPVELTFIYKNGYYYLFIDGVMVMCVDEDQGLSWTSATIGSTVGTDDTIKFGITASYGSATFSDFEVTTDADAINEYVPDEVIDEDDFTPWIK